MALTRSYKETILERLRADEAFRKASYAEALSALQDDEVSVALSMLRDLAHAQGQLSSMCGSERRTLLRDLVHAQGQL